MIYDDVLKHIQVQRYVERASAHWRKLPEQDVFGDSCTVILLSYRCGLHQNLDGLFERASHEGTSVCSIYTVTRDSHQRTSVRHNIDQKGQMSIINARATKFDNVSHFTKQRLTSSLNA